MLVHSNHVLCNLIIPYSVLQFWFFIFREQSLLCIAPLQIENARILESKPVHRSGTSPSDQFRYHYNRRDAASDADDATLTQTERHRTLRDPTREKNQLQKDQQRIRTRSKEDGVGEVPPFCCSRSSRIVNSDCDVHPKQRDVKKPVPIRRVHQDRL